LATGQPHSVQEVVEMAFSKLNLDWRQYVKQDARLLRRTEPLHLVGNPAKAKQQLGWEPHITFAQLIEEMTLAEAQRLARPGPAG
jgi:GDPmannose 4,6-dehydratase